MMTESPVGVLAKRVPFQAVQEPFIISSVSMTEKDVTSDSNN